MSNEKTTNPMLDSVFDDEADPFEDELRALMNRRIPKTAAPSAAVLEPGVVIAGRYCLKARIGRGAMGTIWQAEHAFTGGLVALKIMRQRVLSDPVARKRFQLEALNAAALSHVNIVRVMDFGEEDAMLYLVMEHLKGVSLDQVIATSGPLEWLRAARIAAQILHALDEAHHHPKKIVHRDIKPSNIMLLEQGGHQDFAKVLDFGIARALTGEGAGTRGPIGSPMYMAPELWNNEPIGPAVDLYALGCTVHEMLAGAPPFQARSWPFLGEMHVNKPPPALPETIPSTMREWVLGLMAKAPEDRPGSARDAIDVLIRVMREG